MNECIILDVYSDNAKEKKETIRINHGFELLKPCKFKYFITNVSVMREIQIINKCNDKDLESCSDGIIYKAYYKTANPLVNWKPKKTFNLNLPNGSVMTYVGDKTLCNEVLENKYRGTKITERKVLITKDIEGYDFINFDSDDFFLKSKEDVKIGLFKGKKYVKEKEYIIEDVIFEGYGESIDRINLAKTKEQIRVIYDEDEREINFKNIVRYLVNLIT